MKYSKKMKKFLNEPNFMVLGTLRKNGSIQMTIVWYEFDGKVFRFSTVTGREKPKNLQNDKRVTFVIYDDKNSYRFIQVQGEVISSTKKGGHDFIDKLSKRYFGKEKYPYDPERKEDRITYTIKPTRLFSMGIDERN